MRIARKATSQPMMKFSHFICRGRSHLEPKCLLISHFLRYADFYFTSHDSGIRVNFLFLKFWGGIIQIDFEKNVNV